MASTVIGKLLEIWLQPWRHRHLIWSLASRDLAARFRGSIFGGLWAVLQPIAMVAIFYYVLAVIFKSKWSVDSQSDTDFIVGIFSGLLMYGLFAETVSRSLGTVVQNVNYVKKIVFPITIMPIVQLAFAFANMLIGFTVLIVFGVIAGAISFHVWTLSLLLTTVPVTLWALGTGWFVAALNVYFRDTMVIVPLLLQALMFLSPVFYSADRIPDGVKMIVQWGPLGAAIAQARDILMKGTVVDVSALAVPTLIGFATMIAGYAFFRFVKPGFADVL